MTYEVVMPQLGLTMEEASVVSWKKQAGDWVTKGEVLFTVETDKAEMEVESADSGYLNSLQVGLGEKVRVGTVIALLGDRPGEVTVKDAASATGASIDAGARKAAATHSKPPAKPGVDSTNSGGGRLPTETLSSREIPASPRARRLAEELGIDVNTVKPGRGKRIVEEDIRRFHENRQTVGKETGAGAGSDGTERASARRRIIAQRMSKSFQRALHFYLGVEADATEIVKLREEWPGTDDCAADPKPAYRDLFQRALAIALKEHPHVNAFWRDNDVVPRDSIDLGFAVQAADGLVVPVIRNADQLTLADLTRQRSALTEKAKAGKLELREMAGDSATISNLGSFGVDWFQAILNSSQSILLATSRIAKRAVVVNDSLQLRHSLILSFSADHRVLDGAAAANFLNRVKGLIEAPAAMLRRIAKS